MQYICKNMQILVVRSIPPFRAEINQLFHVTAKTAENPQK